MSAHRTWGLFFVSRESYTQLSEVTFLDAAGTDLSVSGAAYASSEFSAGFVAANAFDKNNGTDWCNMAGDVARRLWYVHSNAVEPTKLRIRCSATSYNPATAGELRVRWSDDLGVTWSEALYRLVVTSGTFGSGNTVVMSFAPPPVFVPWSLPPRLQQNLLLPQASSTGVVSDRVMFKATPSAPESPFAMGRVWLLRLADGYKAWEGWSDQAGYYTATGLELGIEYIAVGIDPLRNHKATGAGPVLATEAAP